MILIELSRTPMPKTRDELTSAGYLMSDSSQCKGCGAAIEWWMTPKARRMLFDVLKDDTLKPHLDSCPQAKEFRKPRMGKKPSQNRR